MAGAGRPRGLPGRLQLARRARSARTILEQLAAAGENMREAAELAHTLFSSWPDDSSSLRRQISEREHRGDQITRELVTALHSNLIGPFARGDIYRLSAAIDDVVDDIEEAAEETAIYQIPAPMDQAVELAGVLRDAARALSRALTGLEHDDDIAADLHDVRRREQEGDRIYRAALGALFEGGIDPMVVIRWKDVLGAIEEAIDRCRNGADVLAAILMKQQ